MKKPPLTLVSPDQDAASTTPAGLLDAGRNLWRTVMVEYQFKDSGGLAMLEVAARALDRAADCAEQIARDGALLITKHGPKDHPLLRHETANRALAVRIIRQLGLDLEPLRPGVGHPGGGHGLTWKQLRDDK